MTKKLRAFAAMLLTVLLLTTTAVPAAAAEKTDVSPPFSLSARVRENEGLTLSDSARITGVRRLSREEADAIADRFSAQSDVYLVELRDGRYTYYIAVDFRKDAADSVYLIYPAVLRKTSHNLYDRTANMAEKEKKVTPVLMDYTHIVGELGLHYWVYRITDSLGGEALKGFLGRLYRSSVVADLNIDETRMPVLIRLIGLLIGQ